MGLFDTYYFVPASDIERAKLICKINDSGREYQSIGRISANELSCLKDIPLEFQRLVLMSGTLKKIVLVYLIRLFQSKMFILLMSLFLILIFVVFLNKEILFL